MIGLTWDFELSLSPTRDTIVVGIDEAGRGPLAGPVVAAAVVFPSLFKTTNDTPLNDSKKLTEKEREELYAFITSESSAFGIGIISPTEIDEINILAATMRAMTTAVSQLESQSALDVKNDMLIVDGNYFRTELPYKYKTIIEGDGLCPSIAAASILAKVTRDRMMKELDAIYPDYGFASHKGYATKAHRDAIIKHGYCPEHRRSFKLKSLEQIEIFG
jgi:ribonuclease HII